MRYNYREYLYLNAPLTKLKVFTVASTLLVDENEVKYCWIKIKDCRHSIFTINQRISSEWFRTRDQFYGPWWIWLNTTFMHSMLKKLSQHKWFYSTVFLNITQSGEQVPSVYDSLICFCIFSNLILFRIKQCQSFYGSGFVYFIPTIRNSICLFFSYQSLQRRILIICLNLKLCQLFLFKNVYVKNINKW